MAEMIRRIRRASVAGLILLPLVAPAPAWADTSPGPPAAGLDCLPETYPHQGAARGAAQVPYNVPFTATLGDPNGTTSPPIGGGFLMINSPSSPFVVILGGPLNAVNNSGSITASGCGTLVLPNETGGIQGPLVNGKPAYGSPLNGFRDTYNGNFLFAKQIPVFIGVKGEPGIPLLGVSPLFGYTSADGELKAQIDRSPAANGGQNVEFYSSAKSTSVLTVGALTGLSNIITLPAPLTQLLKNLPTGTPAASPVPGGECTVPIGDLRQAGLTTAEIQTGATGLTASSGPLSASFNYQTVHLSSRFSAGQPPGATAKLRGQPVTGPITGAQAVLVANDFPVAKIDINTPPSPSAPGADQTPSSLCTPPNASLFNQLLGLPSPAGGNIFYAPGTFAVHTSS